MSYWYRTEVDARKRRPLLLFLHGHSESDGEDLPQTTTHGPWFEGAQVRNARVADQLTAFFRVGPHIPAKRERWNTTLLNELIRNIRTQHAEVDADSVFVIGVSRGGQGAIELTAAHGKELGVRGVVAFCPEKADRLKAALTATPIYLFHGDGDAVVPLDAPEPDLGGKKRSDWYDGLAPEPNFRWQRVAQQKTRGEKHHNCWTDLIGDPRLYAWFHMLAADPGYRNRKETWPDFID